jgi:predicted nuclease with TOPRIM domain
VGEIEQLRQRVAELEKERDKANQYWQIAEGRCDALKQQRDELLSALEKAAAAFWKLDDADVHAQEAESAIASVKEKQNGN